MRILFLGNNWVAWQVLDWLRGQGEAVEGLVVHPEEKQKFGDEIKRVATVDEARTYDGSKLGDPSVFESISACNAELAISVLFDYILPAEFIDLFPHGVINLHPSHLPYNQGQYPNVWSIVDNTPAGVTLHYIDEKVDTGDIIAQQRVEVDPTDTGLTLYRKLEHECVNLFRKTWPSIRAQSAPRRQQSGPRSYHRIRDVDRIDRIDLDETYTARTLIDVLRARTFPPHRGAYFETNGRRIYLRLELSEEDLDG